MPNLAGPHEFFADPFAQYLAERRLSREGLSVIAIYHSHPGGGTELSDADRMAASRWNWAHIVIVPERSAMMQITCALGACQVIRQRKFRSSAKFSSGAFLSANNIWFYDRHRTSRSMVDYRELKGIKFLRSLT